MMRLPPFIPRWILPLVACFAILHADELKLADGSSRAGGLVSLTPQQLIWQAASPEKPMAFTLPQVLEMSLSAEQINPLGKHLATLTLTNGDIVRGQLAAVSSAVVELDTRIAGRMKFNRLMIADIQIAECPDLIYRGPDGLDGWKQSGDTPAWSYQNSVFTSRDAGSIARDLHLPDEFSITFDAAWTGSLSLKLAFFSDSLASDQPNSGYELSFVQHSIYLRSGRTQQIIGNTPDAASLQENDKAHIEVHASRKTGKIGILLDGRLIEVWTDPDVAQCGSGRGIHFISQNSSPVRISRIGVSAWDGEVEQVAKKPAAEPQAGMQEMADESEDAPQQPAPPPTGRIELRNGDSIAGEVDSILDGVLTVKTAFREVKLPVEALRSVVLAPVQLERCKRQSGDVRASFADGSSLVFRLDSVGGGAFGGSSQNFGTARFTLGACQRLEFNLYDPALEERRSSNGG